MFFSAQARDAGAHYRIRSADRKCTAMRTTICIELHLNESPRPPLEPMDGRETTL
jgi:hypothetical protein